ncbi:hypothetical protein CLV63_113200 [Murinocardiopsis flavida]|uniref:Uncharacterized protein n=1 Tax=Murinocardiopsis flavida TaxID=645275 RepID=A0A2P8DFS0_9ACTN|nr:hypothetical protein [Murinocardiopsis flavida]PSK96037.1 hypothetical protein CLV63_113200 [Murinocardiopsis flavida]
MLLDTLGILLSGLILLIGFVLIVTAVLAAVPATLAHLAYNLMLGYVRTGTAAALSVASLLLLASIPYSLIVGGGIWGASLVDLGLRAVLALVLASHVEYRHRASTAETRAGVRLVGESGLLWIARTATRPRR